MTEKKQLNAMLYEDRWVLICSILSGMFVHSQIYINRLVTPDSVPQFFKYIPGAFELSLGRWGWKYMMALRGYLVSPYLAAGLTVIFFSLTGVLLCNLFDIKNKTIRILVCASYTCSPIVAELLTFYYVADLYALAHLLSVFSVFVTTKVRKWWGGVISALLLMLSLSIYQSNLGVAAACSLMYIFVLVCLYQYTIYDVLPICRNLLAMGVGGTACYYVVLKIILNIQDVALSSYRGANNINIFYLLQNINRTIPNAYLDFYDYFFKSTIMVNTFGIKIFYSIMFILFAVILAIYLSSDKNFCRAVLSIGCLFLLPLATNLIDLATPDARINLLTSGGLHTIFPCLLLIMWLLVNKISKNRLFKMLIHGSALLILWSYILINSADATVAQVYNESTIALTGRIYASLEKEGFRINDKLIIVGYPAFGNYPVPNNLWQANEYAKCGLIWPSGDQAYWYGILNNHYGLNVYQNQSWSETIQKCEELKQSAKFQTMPVYPNEGSIQKFGDMYVVKVSDVT